MVKLLENANRYRKLKVYHLLNRVLPYEHADYEGMTRKIMLEEIIENFTPDYLCEICTTWELKALKRLLRNQDLEGERTYFEKRALELKFLYFDKQLPVEFKENVKQALNQVDLDKKAEEDKPILTIIGIIRAFGVIEPTLIQAVCEACHYDYASIVSSSLFNFWAFLKKDYELIDGSLASEFVYRNYEDCLYRMRQTRIEHERFTPKFLEIESYLSIFYHGYDSTNKDIHKFFTAAKKEVDINAFKDFLFENIIEGRITEQNYEAVSIVEGFSPSLQKLYEKAMPQMVLPTLYGMSIQDYLDCQRQASLNEQLKAMNQKQTYACLSDKDSRLFYKLYFSVLDFVNKKENILPHTKIDPNIYTDPDKLVNVIDAFWKNKEKYLDAYCKVNPLKLTYRNLNTIKDFKYGMRKDFLLVLYEKNYTVFNDEGINYMVKGLNANLDTYIPANKTPMIIQTALLPFNGQIIYDGFISMTTLALGQNQISRVFKEYSLGQKVYTLVPTSLN